MTVSQWPTEVRQVPGWAASFGPDLQPYLAWFGALLVKTHGDQHAIGTVADRWERTGRGLEVERDRLERARTSLTVWQGLAAWSFLARVRKLENATAEDRDRVVAAAGLLREVAAALQHARVEAESLTQTFVQQAQHSGQVAAAQAGSVSGVAATAAWRVQVQNLFASLEPLGQDTLGALERSLRAAATRLAALEPGQASQGLEVALTSLAQAEATGVSIPPGVSSFSGPAASLHVDQVGSKLTVTGTLVLIGDASSPEVAVQLQEAIRDKWTASFPDGTSLTTRVDVVLHPQGRPLPAGTTAIVLDSGIVPGAGGSKDRLAGYVDGESGTMFLNARIGDPVLTATHEFGHMLGLSDRYLAIFTDSGMNVMPLPGFQGNLMADDHFGQRVDEVNVHDVMVENDSGPVQGADQARRWVERHPGGGDLTAVAAQDRLAAVQALLSGFVSDSDVDAAEKLLAATPAGPDRAVLLNALRLRPPVVLRPDLHGRVTAAVDALQ